MHWRLQLFQELSLTLNLKCLHFNKVTYTKKKRITSNDNYFNKLISNENYFNIYEITNIIRTTITVGKFLKINLTLSRCCLSFSISAISFLFLAQHKLEFSPSFFTFPQAYIKYKIINLDLWVCGDPSIKKTCIFHFSPLDNCKSVDSGCSWSIKFVVDT